jgi:hypothetical protein
MAGKKKKPKIKVLEWPAIPVPTPEEVYGLTTEEIKELKRRDKGEKSKDPEDKGQIKFPDRPAI